MLHPFHHARKTPDKPAYILANSGAVVTYRELDEESTRIANLFRACGLKPGDHVAWQMENNSLFLQIAFAAQRSGLIFTPLHSHLRSTEAAYILANSGAKLFIASHKKADDLQKLDQSSLPTQHWYCAGGKITGYHSLEKALEQQPQEDTAECIAGVPMFYSSGTTGQPKGILPDLNPTPFDELNLTSQGLSALFQFTSETVYMTPGPLYHAAPLGSVMILLQMGGTAVIMDNFDAELTLQSIQNHKVSVAQFVPIMFIRMLKLPQDQRLQYDTTSLKHVIHAAAPCPIETKRAMIDWWGPIIFEFYSASEGIGMTAIESEDWLSHPGSVGKSVMGQLHIVSDSGEELPSGEIGAIYFSGMPGFKYHGEPEKTELAFSREGWSTVGDVGYVDDDGYLYLSDRKDFMIISGGVNIYPQEVENLLLNHPKLADAAVFGIPHDEFGEQVKAVVQPARWQNAGPKLAAELIDYCKAHLSPVKAPRSIDFERALPRMDNGKLYKKQLRNRYL
jgi:long-chain acyl-CoA synthetase